MAVDLSMLGVSTEGLAVQGMAILQICVYVVFVIIFTTVAIYMLRYRHRALIITSRSGQVCRLKWDFVRKWNDKKTGSMKYHLLLKQKDFRPLSENDSIYSMGRKDTYLLYETKGGDFIHSNFMTPIHLRVPNVNISKWAQLKRREEEDKYRQESWISRHQTFILGIGSLFFVFFIVYFALQHVDKVVGQIGAISGSLESVADQLAQFGQQKINSFPLS